MRYGLVWFAPLTKQGVILITLTFTCGAILATVHYMKPFHGEFCNAFEIDFETFSLRETLSPESLLAAPYSFIGDLSRGQFYLLVLFV